MADKDSIRVKWIDGLKGFAAICVFLHHFTGAFYPAYHTGLAADSRLGGVDVVLSNTPIGILVNGNFWVCVFLSLSAYILTVQILNTDNNHIRQKAGNILLRRYPRLMIPMLAAGIINYCLLEYITAINSPYTLLRQDMSLFRTIWTYGVTCWISPGTNVFGQLWTMHYSFTTAIVVVLFTIFDKKEYKWMPAFYLLMLYPMIMLNECYMSIVFGIMLADIVYYKRIDSYVQSFPFLQKLWNNTTFLKIKALILFALAVVFGGYSLNDSGVSFYEFLRPVVDRLPFLNGYMHGFGTLLLLSAIFIWQKSSGKSIFLERSVFQTLAKYSLSIYIVHGFYIIYFCTFFYYWISQYIKIYNLAVLITFIITLILVMISSVIFNKTVERFTGYIVSKIKLKE